MPDLDPQLQSEQHQAESVAPVKPADVRLAAMNLLARREHSLHELRRKLRRRFTDEQLVDAQLSRLAGENLQSDQRFAESFLRQRSARGYGPLRVAQEMQVRGVAEAEVAAAFASAGVDWSGLATEVFHKKFGQAPVTDIRQQARCARFMQYRGFSHEHYQHLLDY